MPDASLGKQPNVAEHAYWTLIFMSSSAMPRYLSKAQGKLAGPGRLQTGSMTILPVLALGTGSIKNPHAVQRYCQLYVRPR